MLKSKACKHGTFTYHPNDTWIGGGLERYGEYSEAEVQKLLSLVDRDSVVIEIGSNIGTISVPLAKAVKELHCFEPQPQICELLRTNLDHNDLDAHVHQKAVSAKPGTLYLTPLDYDAAHINTGGVAVSDRGTVAVDIVTLDDYCHQFDRLDLIKIDVEGHEGAVIDGAKATIARFRPVLYVENDRAEKSAALIRQIMELGYRLYWHLPPTFNPDACDPYNVVSINMLCVPPNRLIDLTDLSPIMSEHDDWQVAYDKQQRAKPKVPAKLKRTKTWACILRIGGVGDNLIAGSVLPGLKKQYDAVEVITGKPNHVVFENNPYIDKLTVREKDMDWTDGQKFQDYWLSRHQEYELFVNLSHSVEVTGALLPIQTQYYWPAKMRRKLCGQNYLERIADICDVPYDTLAPNFYPDDLEIENAQRTKELVGGRYLAWIISGTRLDKIWPYPTVAIPRIIKELNLPVVIFGAHHRDFATAQEIDRQTTLTNGNSEGLHLACSADANRPHWPVRRVLTQVQQADIVVSPDTGPAWAVAMKPMPKIVMLSHASPENITKHWRSTMTLTADPGRVPCWPCHLLIDEKSYCERLSGQRDGKGAACISDIGVEQVLQSIKQALQPQRLLQAAE